MKHTRINRKPAVWTALALLLVFTAGVWLPAARADSDPGLVRVGYYENEVFQEGAAEGAVKTGYAYEYYRKLSEYTGWKYEYVYGGYGELYQMLLEGEIDLLAGLAWREERVGLIAYPDAIMGSESYYLVKQDTEIGITADPNTLNGKKIGVLDSAMVSVLNRYLEEHDVQANVLIFPDHAQLFSAFDSKQLDVFVAESDGSYVREHAEVLCAFGSSDYYLCVSIKRPDLLAELNEAQTLLAAEEPNYLDSLSTKYYSVSVTARAFSAAEREWIALHSTLFLSEGLAMRMDGQWWGEPNAEWVKRFLQDGRYRPVLALADDETFEKTPCEITYPIAGAFTAFLTERLGVPAYLEQIYKPKQPLKEKLEHAFGMPPEAVEHAFLDWIGK